jgi:hypothetical protein
VSEGAGEGAGAGASEGTGAGARGARGTVWPESAWTAASALTRAGEASCER